MTEFPEVGSAQADSRSPFPVHQREGRWNRQDSRSGSEDGTETTPAHVHGADGMQQCILFPRAVLSAWAAARGEKGPG